MNGAAAQERREHQRQDLSLSIQIRADDTGVVTNYTTRDISAGGLFIETDFPLPVGATASLVIHALSLKLQLDAHGTVVRSVPKPLEGPPGMAIQFDRDALIGWQFLKQLVEG